METEHFENGGTVYVISTPKTPLPWKNQLFSAGYDMEVSQRLSGASYLTENYKRYPVFAAEKQFYIKTQEQVYHLCCGEGQSYRCEHHLYKTVLREEFEQFTSQITVFAPAGQNCEMWQFEIQSRAEQPQTFELYACFEFANIEYQSLSCEYKDGCFYKRSFPYYIKYEEYEKLKPTVRIAYAASWPEADSVECSKRRFWGGDDPYSVPQMVSSGKGSNAPCEYETCVAAFHHELRIGASEKKAVCVMAGAAKTEAEISACIQNAPSFEQALADTEYAFMQELAPLQVHTAFEDLNTFVNAWAKKQVVYLASHNRGGVYCPARNRLQDAMGYAVVNPAAAWEIARSVLQRQRIDGYLKQWYMTDGSPEHGLCQLDHSDACIWLIICCIEIIRLSNNDSLLGSLEPYADSQQKETVLEHLRKAAYYMASQTGTHGLCLMKDGDWTDPINGPGRNGRGESVWNTMALVYAISLLCSIREDETLLRMQRQLTEALNQHCWDEDRYIVAFDDEGLPVGSRADQEGALFLNTQTWALISGVCPSERVQTLRATLRTLKTDCGYLLLYPPFSSWNPQWGKISVKHIGNTENGSVYSHANMFMAYADFLCGREQDAVQTLRAILPTNPNNRANLQLPTFIPNYYVSIPGCDFGRSSNVYSSGAPAWLLWLASKYLRSDDKT